MASVVPMLTTLVIVNFLYLCVQLHKLTLMGVFQEDMLKGKLQNLDRNGI